MKIVIAFDSFKNSLTAVKACEIAADAVSELLPDAKIVQKPMADGGEGTSQAMMKALNGKWIAKKVMGPLPDMLVDAGFAWFENEKTALVEMACASGLELLTKEQMNPLKTTTFGTGQLIKAAAQYRAEKILLAVGGSATVDGGIGAAKALGWQFLDGLGKEIPLGGQGAAVLEKIVQPSDFILPEVEVLCDVDNPLCREHGAARVYGPQKGATAEMVEQLEDGLFHLSQVVKQQLNKDIKDIPGAGAAGGLAAGAIAFMDAKLVSGIGTIIKYSGLFEEIENADWVITGEGSFDRQSLMGKVISGIAESASKTKCKVAVLAGKVSVPQEDYERIGIVTALPCKKEGMSLEYALKNAPALVSAATRELIKKLVMKTTP